MKSLSMLALLITLVARPAAGQHDHANSPHAGAGQPEGTVLTPDEIAQLRNGEGMGLARAAELNHWPGPRHVLDLAQNLGLTNDQVTRVQVIFDRMHAEAVAKGEEIISIERNMATAFSSGAVTPETVRRMTGHLAQLRGDLQAIHLVTHLETRAELTLDQVRAYDRLRGYPAQN